MYQTIKRILFEPKSLHTFGKTKGIKIFGYFVLLLLLFTLPDIINIVDINKVDYQTIASFKEAFYGKEIPFVIENNVLTSKDEATKGVLINLPKYNVDLNIGSVMQTGGKANLVVQLLEDKIIITTKIKTGLSFDLATYEELGIERLDFSEANQPSNDAFWLSFTQVLNKLYDKYQVALTVVGIPITVVTLGIALFLIILFTSFLVNLLNKRMGSTFGVVLKITIVAYTPYVIGSILAIFFNLAVLNTIASMISVFYSLIGVNEYCKGQITNQN